MSLHHAILGLLDSFGEMSGYDLKQRFTESVSNVWAADLSQIYRSLDHLESDQLVVSTPDPTSSRRRKIYAITDAGRADLHQWVQQDLLMETIRNPALLQIFFSKDTPPDRFRQQIHDYRAKFVGLAEEYSAIEAMLHQYIEGGWEDGFFQHLTLLLGKRYAQITIEWCDEILERYEQRQTRETRGDNEHD